MSTSIAAIDELLADTNAALTDAEDQLNHFTEVVNDLRIEVRVLTKARERYEAAAVSLVSRIKASSADEALPTLTTVGKSLDIRWLSMPRTDAVAAALGELQTSLADNAGASPAAIESFLVDKGRDDSRDAVSTTLAHLARTKRASRVGYAQWALAQAALTPDDAAGAASPGDHPTHSVEGGVHHDVDPTSSIQGFD